MLMRLVRFRAFISLCRTQPFASAFAMNRINQFGGRIAF
jgi:hypothetical protein